MICKLQIALFTACLTISVAIQAQHITQFRGPHRDGIYPESNLLKSWPAEGPAMRWKIEGLGNGYTSPALINLPSRQVIANFTIHNFIGLDAATGELLWSRNLIGPGDDIQANTPLYENGFLYYSTGGGNGIVKLALAADGRSITEVWTSPKVSDVHGGFVKVGNYIYSSQYKPRRYCSVDATTGKLPTHTNSIKDH